MFEEKKKFFARHKNKTKQPIHYKSGRGVALEEEWKYANDKNIYEWIYFRYCLEYSMSGSFYFILQPPWTKRNTGKESGNRDGKQDGKRVSPKHKKKGLKKRGKKGKKFENSVHKEIIYCFHEMCEKCYKRIQQNIL